MVINGVKAVQNRRFFGVIAMAKINTRQLALGAVFAGAASLLSGCAGDVTSSSSAVGGTASSKNSVAQSSSSIKASSSSVKASSSASGTVFVPPAEVEPTPPVLMMAINAGGAAATLKGVQYQADAYFTGGEALAGNATIVGTNEPAVYLSERYGAFSYSIPVSNGNYSVSFDQV